MRHRLILFPAIDLKDGQCVRLKLGEMDQATVFNDDPADQARQFEAQGFKYLHIVDLNGAFAGKPVNGHAVDAILQAVKMPVQLGGGIRDLDTIERWLAKGIRRVILGTIAVRDPALVREACKKFAHQIAVGIDAKGGKVAVEGWAETSQLTAIDLAKRFEDAGVAAIIYTDIDRDGVLKGLNLPSTAELARSTKIPVIASGGLASIDDIKQLLLPENRMLEGAITGRALYDGRIDPKEALNLLRTRMNIGDKVKVSKIPADLPKDNAALQKLFKGSLGKTFTVAGFDGDLIELHVGEAFGEAAEKHRIWLEPEYLKHVEA